MALGQVGARTEGDVYQGLFFWRQAADLLRPNSMVERVILEHDDADGVDDVAVFYRAPGVNAGGGRVRADYFQLKYHVDNRDAYSADAIIDPAFISATAKASLLGRFYKTYAHLSKQASEPFRLHLASNWQWKDDDKLAKFLREADGALPDTFFDDGAKGHLGKIRERWRAHLNLDPDTFAAFARTLRFKLNHFGRRDFKELVYLTLEAAGLRTPSDDRVSCPYENLTQKILMEGPNSFDAATLRELCQADGLLAEVDATPLRPFTIGVRSILRFAERLESEVDELVCVLPNFTGRHPASAGSWDKSVTEIQAFLGDPDRRARLRVEEAVIALECHSSLALLAGWELSRTSGAKAAPLQKPTLGVWRPADSKTAGPSWATPQTIERNADADDVAICLSVVCDTRADVEAFLSSVGAPSVRRLVVLTPEGGPSAQSIEGADHAYRLATALPAILTSARPNRVARAHLFCACPNSLMFFIGQQRDALGRLSLYEFDYGIERHGSYQLSFLLPPPVNAVARDQEATP